MCCPQFAIHLEVEADNDPGTFGGLATNRKCTDIFGLLLVSLFFVAVTVLTVYCILKGDITKITNGSDESGNICGKNNIETGYSSFEGYGENMEQKKYVFIKKDPSFDQTKGHRRRKISIKECVTNCTMNGTALVFNFCVTHYSFIPFNLDLLQYWIYLLLVWACSVTIICLFLLIPNFQIASMRWYLRIKAPLILFFIVFILWISAFASSDDDKDHKYFKIGLSLAIFALILFLAYIPSIFSNDMSAKLDLVIPFFMEAWNILHSIPVLCFLPIFYAFAIIGFGLAVIYSSIWVQSYSYLDEVYVRDINETRIDYVLEPIASVTQAFIIYGYFILYEIAKNCQCMIVGGYTAQWYFTRKNDGAPQPAGWQVIVNLFKYHLGTICCGSVILPVIYLFRCIVNMIRGAASGRNKESIYTCSCRSVTDTCLTSYINCLEYYSQNGFVMTAMYGCSFCEGTIRAHKLISQNGFNISAINQLGNFILESFKDPIALVTCITFFVIFDIPIRAAEHFKAIVALVIICIILSYIIADCFSSVIFVIMDTIFLCFCEDCLYNNGTSKPYYMSASTAEFVEKANKYVEPVKWKDIADKWGKGAKR